MQDIYISCNIQNSFLYGNELAHPKGTSDESDIFGDFTLWLKFTVSIHEILF